MWDHAIKVYFTLTKWPYFLPILQAGVVKTQQFSHASDKAESRIPNPWGDLLYLLHKNMKQTY